MGKEFLTIKRPSDFYRSKVETINDWKDVEVVPTTKEIAEQGLRCMSCGVPFCHGAGCSLFNVIPEMNAYAAKGKWLEAWTVLNSTSNMPEFTARICPALCENSCCASLVTEPVSIRQIEKVIVEEAFKNGWVTPIVPAVRTGKKVAVIGSGPSGLEMAIELNKKGHEVFVYEKSDKPGGLLRYGIPSFKLEKDIVDRRIDVMEKSGITFICSTNVGVDISMEYISKTYDAVVITTGTPNARNLEVDGRDLKGIDFALELLTDKIDVADKNVVVIGGGDTGNDCVSYSYRAKAKSITQIDLMPEPPKERSESTPWPEWAYKKYKTHSDYMGATRRWATLTNKFVGDKGKVTGIEVSPIAWEYSELGKPTKFDKTNSTEMIKADIVLLAMGYLKSEHDTSNPKVFVAGDAATGQSLVVRTIANAKSVAKDVNEFLS